MKNTLALMQREWLQYRFAWMLMALIPTVLVLLLLGFGDIQLSSEEHGPHLPVALTMVSLLGGMVLHLLILWIVAVVVTAGVARRDHADRSVAFWLSLPTGHGESLAVPLLVHVLLAPLAALGVGLASGLLASVVLVSRVEGAAAWLSLPWGAMAIAALSIALRLAVGVLLAAFWLAPLWLLTVTLSAWFSRWGLVMLALVLGVGTTVLAAGFGITWPATWLRTIFNEAWQAIAGSRPELDLGSGQAWFDALSLIPTLAWQDVSRSVAQLASPVLLAGLVLAAACFVTLVQWRRRGAGDAG